MLPSALLCTYHVPLCVDFRTPHVVQSDCIERQGPAAGGLFGRE